MRIWPKRAWNEYHLKPDLVFIAYWVSKGHKFYKIMVFPVLRYNIDTTQFFIIRDIWGLFLVNIYPSNIQLTQYP